MSDRTKREDEAVSERSAEVDQELCSGCGDCAAVCPLGGIVVVDGKALVPQDAPCDACTDCEVACPSGAIGVAYEIVYDGQGEGKTERTVVE